MWKDTAVTRLLAIDVPIVQGPMGNNYSPPALVAKVSNAGALGSLGAYGMDAATLRTRIAEIRAATKRTFSVNLWVPLASEGGPPPDAATWERALRTTDAYHRELSVDPPPPPPQAPRLFEQQVEVILAEQPPVFSFVFGVPPKEVLAACRARGIKTLGTATNVAEARALEAAGVDAIVASGAEGGGHRGLFVGEPSDALTGTIALVPLIRDAVKVPVIAAGGIADGRGIAAALALGADAVQIGTAFIAAPESGASDTHRDALASEAAYHTGVTRVLSGRNGRGIRNRVVRELEAAPDAVLPFPYQGSLMLPLRAAAGHAGRADIAPLWAGQAAPLARRAGADQIVQRLIGETEQALARLKAL
ncbi:MAG: nitronate monooxygenase [Polyangiales bacterium]